MAEVVFGGVQLFVEYSVRSIVQDSVVPSDGLLPELAASGQNDCTCRDTSSAR
jgi:hypothetical protein